MTNNLPGAGWTRDPLCPRFCPGCHNREASPAERLAEKIRFIEKFLSSWKDRLAPVQEAAPDNRRGYRERVCLAAEWRDGGWEFGLNCRQTLIPIHDCPVHSSRVNRTINLLAGILPPAGQFPLVYYLQAGGHITLVVKSRDLPDTSSWRNREVTENLRRIGDKALWLHLHPAAGRRVTAKNTWHLLWGEPRSTDKGGLVYGPTAFRQLIPDLSEAALDEAELFLAPDADAFVLDLYCGIGGSLRRWTGRARQVAGVEISGESVDCARRNAPGATLFRGAGRHRLPQLTEMLPLTGHQRLLYVNPPRTGIEPEVTDWIRDVFTPSRIACLSCNAVSLGKDLAQLTEAGYRVKRILPFDFFPETRYLEMLALLTRQ